jgi:hypothetical protein
MRAGAVRPSGSVWLATPRRGRSRLPGRRFVPASDVAHARTHWRAACKWGGAASSCRSASRFKLAGQTPAFRRQTGGRRITVRRPLLPRVIRWGIHRSYLTAAKRVLSPFQRMLQMWLVSPNPHPRFRQSHSTVRLPCASSSRSMQPNFARTAVLCARPDTRMYAYGIAPRGHGQAFAALHRSCAKVGRLKRGPFQDRSNADLHACVRV